ncbi:hypothetical protein [Pelotalea chapellei]|uniref:Uncharacterized protein n=1 Tax=Pelotalea chapellei TaxID=44671 RepID=A0ABS5U7H8_9BACT|nr:hypothetical protein [Pelotalea chapellei]MBT1071624.1 hypothetical protein [Pelotalea chapellei]
MKKIICSLVIIALSVSPALAIAPLILTAAEVAAPFVVQAGVKYLLPTSATSNVPSYGSADNYGLKRNSIGTVMASVGAAAVLTIGFEALRTYVDSNKSSHPLLDSALNANKNYFAPSDIPGLGSGSQTLPLNTVLKASGNNYYKIVGAGSVSPRNACYTPSIDAISYSSGQINVLTFGGSGDCSMYAGTLRANAMTSYPVVSVTAPVPSPSTQEQFNALVAPFGSISPAYQPEIDSAFRLGVPFSSSLPSSELAKVDQNYARQEQITHLNNAVQNATNIYNNYPSDSTLQSLNDIKAQLAAAQAQQASESADQSKDEKASEVLNVPTAEAPVAFNLNKLNDLKGAMSGAYPFNYISRISSYFDALATSNHAAPVFDFHIYKDINAHVDLSFFDPVMDVVRWVLSLLLSVGAIMFVIKFYRGVS